MRKGFKQLSSAISLLLVLLLLIPLTNSFASANSNTDPRIMKEIQRAYDEMGITALWNMGLTGSGMKIAIIDDGVDYTNPDLGGCFGPNCKVIAGWDVDNNDPDPMPVEPSTSHGTLLAGEMVANGSMKGIAYDAKLLAYKADGTGGPDVGFRALERLLQDGGADYLNFSSGFTVQGREDNFTKEFTDPYYRRLYEQAEKQGMLIFISPGNFGSALIEDGRHWFPIFRPMYYFSPVGNRIAEPTTLSIGAYEIFSNGGEIAEYSSIGPSLNGEMQPDLLAYVGYPITYMGPMFGSTGGTSCSAPFAGAVATLVKQAHKDWTAEQVRASLMNTASVLYNKVTGEPISVMIQGSGLIDGVAAVKTPALITPYEIDMTATGLHPVVLTVKNVSDATLTFTVTVQPTLGNFEYGQNDGLTFSLTSSRIVVSPRLSATLGLTAKADLSKLTKGSHEALIWLYSGTATLHVPMLIWNDLNYIWWNRSGADVGNNQNPPPKLTNIRVSNIPGTSNVAIGFTVNRGSFLRYTYGQPEPSLGIYADKVRIDILNQSGATVATVFNQEHLLIGHYQTVWNGKDNKGQPVPAGTYRYVISAPDYYDAFYTSAEAIGTLTVDSSGKITIQHTLEFIDSAFAPIKPPILQGYGEPPPRTSTIIQLQPDQPTPLFQPIHYKEMPQPQPPGPEPQPQPEPQPVPITPTTQPAPLSVIELQIGNPVFKLNNQAMLLDSPPVIKNDRTLLPIRAVVEAMGGQVNWNAEERRVGIEYRGKTVTLWIGKNTAKVNGKEVMIDPSNPNVVPEIINGRTMLPLRFVAESLGCQVEWDDKTKTITIRFPSY